MGMATSYRTLGRREDALVGFRRLIEVSGDNTRATLAIADIEFERGNFDQAAQALEDAVDTTEAPSLINNKLGEVRVEQGRTAEAMKLFAKAVEEKDDFALPYFNLAVLYEERGEVQRAVSNYEKAVELGVHRIIPLRCEHGVIDPREGKLSRWVTLMKSALKQCGRSWLPVIARCRRAML